MKDAKACPRAARNVLAFVKRLGLKKVGDAWLRRP